MSSPAAQHPNTFGALDTLKNGESSVRIFRLNAIEAALPEARLSRLPFSLRILLEICCAVKMA